MKEKIIYMYGVEAPNYKEIFKIVKEVLQNSKVEFEIIKENSQNDLLSGKVYFNNELIKMYLKIENNKTVFIDILESSKEGKNIIKKISELNS